MYKSRARSIYAYLCCILCICLQLHSGLAWPQARSYGCDPPLELEASSSNSNMLHLQLQLLQTAHRCSSFRNHRPVTQPQSYVCVCVCVCSGRKSENNCMKTRDGSLKEARTANAASSDERQTKRGRQQSAHTHTNTHTAALLMLQAERVQLENGWSVSIRAECGEC